MLFRNCYTMAPSWTLLPLICVVFSTCQAVDYGWLSRKEFSFTLQGKDLAGLPQLKSQYAGFSYSGELRVQSHSPRILLLKFFNMNYTKIHEELTEGWWNGPDSSSRNKTKPLSITTSAVVVKMTPSTSPEIIMEAGLDDWQVNFIKGIVSKIIAFLNDNSVIGPNGQRHSGYEQRDVFSVIEDSVVGRCQVLYEVNPLPTVLGLFSSKLCDSGNGNRQMWEITKTYNFSNCQMLSEDHAHLPSKDCTPGGANCGQFWSRASLTQMVGCGEVNNFLLLHSISSSTMNAHLHLQNDSQAVVNSNLNITLTSLMDLKRKFSLPQNKQTFKSLFYSYSKMPKDLYSRSCQDIAASSSEEEKNPNKLEVEELPNMGGKTNKRVNDSKERGRLIRDKRLVKNKYGPMRKTGNQNNDDLFGESSNDHPTFNYNGTSFNTRKNKKNYKSWERSSEEFNNQPSEELQLEEQWEISGKEQKSEPPHQPFNMFYLAHRRSEDFSCLNQKLRQVIADIASDLEDINILPEKNAMDKFSLAVDICKSMPLDHLSSVSEEIFEIHSGHSNIMKSKERNVFRDVVTLCGTHPAFKLIKGWIARQQVEGEEAAQMIASLPSHIYSPSRDLLEEFFVMVQQIAQKDEEQLTVTAVLALSNLVRQACVNQRTRQNQFSSIIRPVCDPSFAKQLVGWLVHQLESDPNPNQSRVYVEALGNVGNSDTIEILGNIAMNQKYSSYIKTSAVFAMRYQGLRKSPAIAPLLLSLYHNYTLPANTRIAAVALLIYSDPGLAIWQRLAISTWYEPSPAVAHFVSFSIRSMATTQDTLYSHMSKSAKLVLPLSKPSKATPYKPYIHLSSWHTSDFGRVVLEQLSWMQFFDFSNIYYRHSSRSCGFSRTNIEASVTAANHDDLWSALKELFISSSDDHGSQRPNKAMTHSLAQLQDILNIRHRTMPSLQADLHMKINNMMERMFFIDRDSLKSWAKDGRKMLLEVLSEGKTLYYQKADMDSFHISTTTDLGFPVEFKVRTPSIVQAKADLNMTGEGLVVGAAFMYSSQLLSSMGVMSPWDNTAHLAGAYATNFFQLPPLRVVVKLDSSFSELKLTSSYIDQHRLLYISMQPFTSQYKMTIHQPTLLSPDTTRIQLGETVQMPISWLNLKTVYSSEETESFNPMDYIQQARVVVGFPLMMPNMETKSFETVMNPMHPVIMNFSMSMASKSHGLLEYESPWEALVRKVVHGFSKANKSQEIPELPSTKKSNIEPDPSNQSSKSTQNEDSTKNKGNTHGKLGPVSNNETKSVEESNSPVYSERYQVYSTTYESATGNFNASDVNPFTNNVNGSSKSYLLEQTLSKINSGKAVILEFSLHSTNQDQPTNIAAFAAFATTYSKRVDRFGLFLKKDSSQVRMTAVHEDPIDIATDLSQRVNQDLQHNLFVDYVGAFSGQDLIVSMKASLGASRVTLAQLRATSLLIECSQLDNQNFDSSIDMRCRRIHSQVKEIGFGNISVYYNEHGKFLENVAHMYMNTAKLMIPRTEIKSGQGYNTMTLMFDFSPRTESVNVFIATPAKSISMHRLPLYYIPMSSMIDWSKQDISPEDYCGISSRRVRTFDSAQLDYQTHNDWQLVAYDFSGKYNFSVVTRAASNNSLEVELNIRDQYLVSMADGPKVHLNNNQQPLNGSHPLLRIIDQAGYLLAHIVHTPDNSIHINLPQDKLDLVYHGTTLIVKAEPVLQGRLGGLCGTYSNSGVEKFLTAQGTSAKSYREFIQSYIIRNSKSDQVDTDHWSENV